MFCRYYTHEAAGDCVNYVSGTNLDGRVIRADWDSGFEEGRQFGRGSSGGQIRDELRDYYDPERGDRRSHKGGHGNEEKPQQRESENRHRSMPREGGHHDHEGQKHHDRGSRAFVERPLGGVLPDIDQRRQGARGLVDHGG